MADGEYPDLEREAYLRRALQDAHADLEQARNPGKGRAPSSQGVAALWRVVLNIRTELDTTTEAPEVRDPFADLTPAEMLETFAGIASEMPPPVLLRLRKVLDDAIHSQRREAG